MEETIFQYELDELFNRRIFLSDNAIANFLTDENLEEVVRVKVNEVFLDKSKSIIEGYKKHKDPSEEDKKALIKYTLQFFFGSLPTEIVKPEDLDFSEIKTRIEGIWKSFAHTIFSEMGLDYNNKDDPLIQYINENDIPRKYLEALLENEEADLVKELTKNKRVMFHYYTVPNSITKVIEGSSREWNAAISRINTLVTQLNKWIKEEKDNNELRDVRTKAPQPVEGEQEVYRNALIKYHNVKRTYKLMDFFPNPWKIFTIWRLSRHAKKVLQQFKKQEAMDNANSKTFSYGEENLPNNLENFKPIKGYNLKKVISKLAKYQSKFSRDDKGNLTATLSAERENNFEKTKAPKGVLYYHSKAAVFHSIASDQWMSDGTRGAAAMLAFNSSRKYNYFLENEQLKEASEQLLTDNGITF